MAICKKIRSLQPIRAEIQNLQSSNCIYTFKLMLS